MTLFNCEKHGLRVVADDHRKASEHKNRANHEGRRQVDFAEQRSHANSRARCHRPGSHRIAPVSGAVRVPRRWNAPSFLVVVRVAGPLGLVGRNQGRRLLPDVQVGKDHFQHAAALPAVAKGVRKPL